MSFAMSLSCVAATWLAAAEKASLRVGGAVGAELEPPPPHAAQSSPTAIIDDAKRSKFKITPSASPVEEPGVSPVVQPLLPPIALTAIR